MRVMRINADAPNNHYCRRGGGRRLTLCLPLTALAAVCLAPHFLTVSYTGSAFISARGDAAASSHALGRGLDFGSRVGVLAVPSVTLSAAARAERTRVEATLGGVLPALVAFACAGAISFRHLRQPRRKRSQCASRKRSSDSAGAVVPLLRIGTRGSPLALAQAYETKRRLAEAHPELSAEDAVQIHVISTTGDQRLDISLSEIGGKGLFTRELDVALLSGEVDFCVHSTKDVPTSLAEGTELVTMLPREDTRDVLITRDGTTRLQDLPAGSVVGTASLRRQAQILALNPAIRCVNFRGNVQTRLRKLRDGVVDATLLAYAGLKRMNMEHHATALLEWEEMLPAVAQGAISFQCRSDDEKTLAYLKPLNDTPTMQAVTCERAFLASLDGNCKTPIAAQARVVDGKLLFEGLVASPDGKQIFRARVEGSPEDAEAIGRSSGLNVRRQAGEEFLQEIKEYVDDMAAANTKPSKS
eukprot:TRINITY_DN38597_c0_g1_i1.p1 TRINITY_DN38597_c0_g1~~TRINITY_DN38597_c0_g1_i1.p1  ORF type:complete len:472 (-),score=84.95 TRINITY_DN38597_c0_g1_i1:132-1547(-)